MILRAKALARVTAVVLVCTAIAAGVARTEWLRLVENLYYDYWHVLQGVRYQPRHTALVVVDDATLVALKDDPLAFWAPYWGRAIDTLTEAGAKAVALDFVYQVSAENWLRKLELPDSDIARSYDSPLRAALAGGNVVLITHLVALPDGDLQLLAPPEDQVLALPGGSADLGIANLQADPDKHVRRFYPVMLPDPALPGLGLGMQLALRATGASTQQSEWQVGATTIRRETAAYAIGYTGPPGTIPSVSLVTLLRPGALARPEVQALKGKVAIIAANNTGTPDRHFTPYSRDTGAEQMAGGEIHANIVETILSGRFPTRLPAWLEFLYVAAALALLTPFLLRLKVSHAAALAAAACALVAAPAYAAFHADWVLPVAGPQAGIAAAFLVTLALRLTGEERERARIRSIFGRYVSEDIVEKLLAEGRRPDLGGEAMHVTVLFSDIRGFTTLSEKLTAHEVVEMLNAYFTRVCEPILAQGGTLDKYIGDAVMAVFGSPAPHPDHARRAIRAALGMAREAEGFKQWMRERFAGRGLDEFRIGIGLHTGEAVIGDIGTPKRREFTAIGDTVNAASRLEGVTKDMSCVIAASAATVSAAGAGVRTGRVEEIKVKGKSTALRVHEVLGLEEAAPSGGEHAF